MEEAGSGIRSGIGRSRGASLATMGWSLVELMVVIAILAILAGVTLPALTGVKKRAHNMLCQHHLKQWGMATHLYATDFEGWLPKDGSSNGQSKFGGWYISLPPYLNLPPYSQWPGRTNLHARPGISPYLCPANLKISDGKNLFHYCLNRSVNGSGAGNQVNISHIRNPASLIWLFDNGKKAGVASAANLHTNIHPSGPNILVLDGHVESVKRHDMMYNKENKLNPLIPGLHWLPK